MADDPAVWAKSLRRQRDEAIADRNDAIASRDEAIASRDEARRNRERLRAERDQALRDLDTARRERDIDRGHLLSAWRDRDAALDAAKKAEERAAEFARNLGEECEKRGVAERRAEELEKRLVVTTRRLEVVTRGADRAIYHKRRADELESQLAEVKRLRAERDPNASKPLRGEPQYLAAMAELRELMDMQPDAGSPEGERLGALAMLVDEYERAAFPIENDDEVQRLRSALSSRASALYFAERQLRVALRQANNWARDEACRSTRLMDERDEARAERDEARAKLAAQREAVADVLHCVLDENIEGAQAALDRVIDIVEGT